MNVERIWAMPNKNTFSILPINNLIHEEIDPFIMRGGVDLQ